MIISGQVEKVLFTSTTGFTVIRLNSQNETVRVVGNLFGVGPGEVIRVEGEWAEDQRYGRQFRAESYEYLPPDTKTGIERYLSSGLIKGIGPYLAHRIVEAFGDKTLDVIEKQPDDLLKVDGINTTRLNKITEAWEQHKGIREIMVFLGRYKISPSRAAKIYKKFGRQAITVLKENPYCLASEIGGIGFLTADRIAQSMGIPQNAASRLMEGCLYTLEQITQEGHVFCPITVLLNRASELLGCKVPEKLLHQLERQKKIVLDGNRVYLKPLYEAETGLADKLTALKNSPANLKSIKTARAINWVERELKLNLAERQKEAVQKALEEKVLVVTGGPGTGKTTIVRAILAILEKVAPKIYLAAPTGRAAKRLEEVTGHEAKTVHRLLEYSPNGFRRNETCPLDADVVIIDEVSMLDLELMHALIRALPTGCNLILVGDINQLPSVGPGNVLKDIIESGTFPVVYLTEVFRQAQKSNIVLNAHRIKNGSFPTTGGDFTFIEEADPERVAELIVRTCRREAAAGKDVQVLSLMRRGTVGVENLNKLLQGVLNPNGREIARGFRIGDRVMQIRNNYDKDIYNGDIGRIIGVNDEEQEVVVEFDDKRISYDYVDLDELALAYAASVHKAQGSEYPTVIMPVLTQHYLLLQRNVIYTGLTRAKEQAILIGTRKAVWIALRNSRAQQRYTFLKERLVERDGGKTKDNQKAAGSSAADLT